MALPATDNFTAADGTVLTTYSASWTAMRNNFVINTNATCPDGSFDDCACGWTADTFNNDQYAQAVVAAMDGASQVSAGVCVRATAANYYAFYVTTGARALIKIVAGSKTSLASDTTTCAVNDVLKLVVAGTTLTAYVNGVSVLTTTDSDLSSGSAGVAGIGHFSGSTAGRVDNWEGGNGSGVAPSDRLASAFLIVPPFPFSFDL